MNWFREFNFVRLQINVEACFQWNLPRSSECLQTSVCLSRNISHTCTTLLDGVTLFLQLMDAKNVRKHTGFSPKRLSRNSNALFKKAESV